MCNEDNLIVDIPDSIIISFLEEEQAQERAWENQWWVQDVYPEYVDYIDDPNNYSYGNLI